MDVSVRHARRDTTAPRSGMRIVGLIVTIGCLVVGPQLRAERMNHRGERAGHARMTHQAGRHYGRHRSGADDGYYGDRDYANGAPPVIYAPTPAPGIALFIPLRLR
ncbi:hypothetical protein WG70_04530 [Burkholderia oklahomensis EO147]|nr:hypothetical protein WG70_04530 [Burkholderia oklahomensis EO147]AOI50174.1 hypothetical protein WI23_22715 [Burkholderia oklahomensis C6786]MBI0363160.1 hypothetical protein [Burkholderia oklahomensis]KUY47507.1 hypothetical protein WI23_29665 [Burkholderia oklahomensis C6786]KUY65710.1 hypothetical protein WG70_27970 [Burkholderia oklahomensis EO147]